MATATSVHDVILTVVSVMQGAVTYEVFDGPPTKLPGRKENKFLVIGAEAPLTDDEAPVYDAATMAQEWKGLGQKRREEEIRINCVAVGKASTVPIARGYAVGILDDIATNLPVHPGSDNTYNALISEVNSTRVRNVPGGAVVQIQFIISAHANLF